MTIIVSGTSGVDLVTDASITPIKLSQKLTAMTAINTTSGTQINYTGIPSWVRRITIMFNGVSTNGVSIPVIRIGSSIGISTTGYLGAGVQLIDAATNNSTIEASGFQIRNAVALNNLNGAVILSLVDGFTWVASGCLSSSAAAYTFIVSGSKTLIGTLDRVQVTTLLNTDVFDAGLINIMYE